MLCVDGFLSQSNDEHLHETMRKLFRAKAPSYAAPLLAFSYQGLDRSYQWTHTLRSMRRHITKLHKQLRLTPSSAKVVPLGFSLGAPITLIAVQQLLRNNEAQCRARIPLIILVQPAMHGSVLKDLPLRVSFNRNFNRFVKKS